MTFVTTRTFKRKFGKMKDMRRKRGNSMQEHVFQVIEYVISFVRCPDVHSSDKIFVMSSELVEKLLDSERSHDCQSPAFSI